MATRAEAQPLASGEGAADRERLGAALVAALELALVAAHRLLGELDSAAGRHADAAARLSRARALVESAAAPDERALTLLALAGPRADHRRADRGAGMAELGTCQARPPDEAPTPHRVEPGRAGGVTGTPAAPGYPDRLTRREVEVLRLVAAGQSNREIAAALYLSPRTAERHVANIYLKIGAHSKAEAAAYALRHGLA